MICAGRHKSPCEVHRVVQRVAPAACGTPCRRDRFGQSPLGLPDRPNEASLGLMSIVGERSVYDHERLLFLRPMSFLSSKMATLWPMAVMQTAVFSIASFALRQWFVQERDVWFHEARWAAVCLALTSCAAVGVGVAISALAWTRHEVANFLLPLVMMMQIVFSMQVAGNAEGAGRGRERLQSAYRGYHRRSCQGAIGCVARDVVWIPSDGGWLCEDCREEFRKLDPTIGPTPPTIEQRQQIKKSLVRKVCQRSA